MINHFLRVFCKVLSFTELLSKINKLSNIFSQAFYSFGGFFDKIERFSNVPTSSSN